MFNYNHNSNYLKDIYLIYNDKSNTTFYHKQIYNANIHYINNKRKLMLYI